MYFVRSKPWLFIYTKIVFFFKIQEKMSGNVDGGCEEEESEEESEAEEEEPNDGNDEIHDRGSHPDFPICISEDEV